MLIVGIHIAPMSDYSCAKLPSWLHGGTFTFILFLSAISFVLLLNARMPRQDIIIGSARLPEASSGPRYEAGAKDQVSGTGISG